MVEGVQERATRWLPIVLAGAAVVAFGSRVETSMDALTKAINGLEPRVKKIEAKVAAYDEGFTRYYDRTLPKLEADVEELKRAGAQTAEQVIAIRETLTLIRQDIRRGQRRR